MKLRKNQKGPEAIEQIGGFAERGVTHQSQATPRPGERFDKIVCGRGGEAAEEAPGVPRGQETNEAERKEVKDAEPCHPRPQGAGGRP